MLTWCETFGVDGGGVARAASEGDDDSLDARADDCTAMINANMQRQPIAFLSK